MTTRPPSGFPPPAIATMGALSVDLVALAEEVCDRYYREFPDEDERYGDAGVAWCRHDNQWLLSWAVEDVRGTTDLSRHARWLAGVLDSRGFPLQRLVRDLEIAAEVAGGSVFGDRSEQVAGRLRDAAQDIGGAG